MEGQLQKKSSWRGAWDPRWCKLAHEGLIIHAKPNARWVGGNHAPALLTLIQLQLQFGGRRTCPCTLVQLVDAGGGAVFTPF